MSTTTMTIHELLNQLKDHTKSELRFTVDSAEILPGYHITEVKHARVQSLDCGSGSDQWDEIIIQLLDGSLSSVHPHMSAAKFTSIVDAALKPLPDVDSADLFFEFSAGNDAMQRIVIKGINRTDDGISVELSGVRATCKPMQRLLKSATPKAMQGSCCT